jgi:hypothetical protein
MSETHDNAGDEKIEKIRFELVPPTTSFEMASYDGTLITITGTYVTDDPRIIGALGEQSHAVRRVSAKK